MTYSCDNCGQPALETDTVCWHCGQPLPRRERPKPAPVEDSAAVSAIAVVDEEDAPPVSFGSVAAYGALTLVIVVALLLVIRSLGQRPLLIQRAEAELKPGWTAVTDARRLFTINFPPGWRWWDRYDPDQADELTELVSQDGRFLAALAPYFDLAADQQLLLAARAELEGGETAVFPFVAVTRSEALSQYAPEQIVAYLGEEPAGVMVQRAELGEGIEDDSEQAIVILELPYQGQTLRCQQRFLRQGETAYVIVGCSGTDQYLAFTNQFHDVLVSFQPLTS